MGECKSWPPPHGVKRDLFTGGEKINFNDCLMLFLNL